MDQTLAVLRRVSRLVDTSLAYPEICYQTLIMRLLERHGLTVQKEVTCNYYVEKIRFGYGRIDLLVTTNDQIIIIELKANTNKKTQALNQLKRYMKHYKSYKQVQGILAMYNANTPCNIVKVRVLCGRN
jgi:GxxExxY protein